MDNLSNFLTGLNTEESLFFLAFILGGFLLGMLLGSLLRSSAIRRRKKELEKKNEELIDLQGQHNALTQKHAQLETEIKSIKQEKEDISAKLALVEEENNKLHKTVFQLNSDYSKIKHSSQSYETTIDDLNEQIIALKAQNQQPSSEEVTSDVETRSLDEEEDNAENNIRFSEAPLVVDLSDGKNSMQDDRLDALEQKLEHLMADNNLLRRELEVIKADQQGNSTTTKNIETNDTLENDPFFPQDGADLNRSIDPVVETADIDPFPAKESSETSINGDSHDDLTMIEGIGPFIEQKLNDIGIYTYEQIGDFDDAKIEEVTEKIQFFEGRIKKDDWVNQAKSLHQIKLQNPDAFNVIVEEENPDLLPDVPEPVEDLKIIEGIGPKIEALLKDNSIKNVADIAAASSTHLQEILEGAGGSFKLHDATTWPAQARLAVNGDWELLKEYQDKLKGGREVEEKE